MLIRLPGGLCFAHGPYENAYKCPRWPACITDPSQPQWRDLSFSRAKHAALMGAAAMLEQENLLPETVVQLRHKAESCPRY